MKFVEGPERMRGRSWAEAIGTFFIFQDRHRKTRWAYGQNEAEEIVWDDGMVIDVSKDRDMRAAGWRSVETHGPLHHSADIRGISRPRREDNVKGIKGRVWDINNKLYVGFWNAPSRLSRFPGFISAFKNMMKKLFPNRDQSAIYINPHHGDEQYIPVDQFKSTKMPRARISPEMRRQQQLHLLPPAEKSAYLKQIGAQPKIGSEPEWMRKVKAGVDESMMLSKIVKRILKYE